MKVDLRPGIIRYIKKLKRMKQWAHRHRNGQMEIECAEQIVAWEARLRHLFRLRGYRV